QNEYLTEPTDEFKAMEKAQGEFRKAQRAYKAEFDKMLDTFLAAKTDDELVKRLSAVTAKQGLVQARGGLPEGVKMKTVFASCRKLKSERK
ncbi:unnamed protein product, partial [Phaeothamnion confervicola]